jgi:hypothetical protein
VEEIKSKAELFAYMVENGIEKVYVEFDGYGDEGHFETTEITMKAGHEEPVDAENLITDFFAEHLCDAHPGWEINDGSQGDFTAVAPTDEDEGSITLSFGSRRTEVDYENYDL